MAEPTASTDAGQAGPPAPRVIVERPPPGLARGKFAWPAWGIGVIGGAVLVVALSYFLVRWLRSRRR